MKQLSFWAQQHKWAARIIIVAIYFLLNVIGFFLGDVLTAAEITLPGYLPYLLTIPFLAVFLFYPNRKEKARYKNFYRSRKTADAALAGITFLLIICMSNRLSEQHEWHIMAAHSASVTPAPKNVEETNDRKKSIQPKKKNDFSIKQIKKELRKNLQTLRKEYKAAADSGKTGLVVLSVLVALLLLYLLVVLSCSIACSGSEGLAWAVFIIGTGLIVLLLVRTIRRINRRTVKTSEPPNSF